MKIITISGISGSGKDTSANFILKKLKKNGYKVIKVALADCLKVICQKIIKLFYGIDIHIDEFYDREKKELIRENLPYFNGSPFKIRNVLQQIGTQIFRDNLWNDIWCDFIYKNYINKKYDYIIISDCRFPNELKYFEKYNTISIKINRKLKDNCTSHVSESFIDSIKTTYTIDNNSSIKELYKKIDKIFL